MGAITLLLVFVVGLAAQDASQELSQAGAQAMRAGRFAEAERVYRQLLKQAPANPDWLANLGLALHSQARYREAVDTLERSIKLRPSAGLSVVLGIDYLKLGDACRAITPLERTDRKDALADAYAGCKRWREAAKLYEKLGNARQAGTAYWQARDYADAKRVFAALADQHATEPEFAYEYGDTLLRLEGAEPALPWLRRAAAIVQGRAALGKALVEVGKLEEAIPHLEAAVRADPDLLLPLSRAYKGTGRAAEAERALSEYRKRQAAQN